MQRLLLAASLLLLGVASPASLKDPAEAITAENDRNLALRSYTFDLHVNIVVHTFPSLRFHLDGVGTYERPQHVVVRFTHVPWFGKGFERVDLAAFDPRTWPGQYTIAVARRDGDLTELAMHDRAKSPLKEARATLDAHAGVRRMIWEYDYGGRIEVNVTPAQVSGFALPSTEDAEIKMPGVKASAHAEFTNYRVVSDEAANAP
jgi:hypothetical protein